jgi:hypothetical protein
MSDTITVDGENYTAEPRASYAPGAIAWVVRWYKGILPSGEFLEGEVWPPVGVTWTAMDAVQEAIKRNRWH